MPTPTSSTDAGSGTAVMLAEYEKFGPKSCDYEPRVSEYASAPNVIGIGVMALD